MAVVRKEDGAAVEAGAPAEAVLRRNVALLALAQALFFMGNATMMSTSSLVGLALAPDPAMATVPLGLQFGGIMLATYPASLLMNRIGRRAGFWIGAAFCTAGGLLAALAVGWGSFVLFALASLLYGVFAAFGQYYRFAAADAAEVVSAELRSAARARAIGWVMAGGVLAAVLGPELARSTSTLLPATPFLASYLALAGLGLLTALVVAGIRLHPAPHRLGMAHGAPFAAILSRPGIRAAMVSAVLAYVVMNLLMTSTPLAMSAAEHRFDDTARVIQAHLFGMFAPSFLTGHLIARFGASRVVLAGAGLVALCVALALSGITVAAFAGALFLLGVGWNFMFVGATALLTEHHRPEEKARVQGLNDLLVFLGVTVSATASGALHELFGWRLLNLLVVPALALVVLSVLAADRRLKADGALAERSGS